MTARALAPITTLVAAFSLLATTVAPASAFDDVPPGKFFTDAVEWMVDQDITTGTSPTTFSPYRDVTRAELVTFLWRLVGRPDSTFVPPATDVPTGGPYAVAIAWAYEIGLTTGRTPTTFAPDAAVRRNEVVTFLWRYSCSPVGFPDHGFTDVPDGAWFEDAVTWAKANAITQGRTPTTFDPWANTNRAEAATFIWRLAGHPAAGETGHNRATGLPDCTGDVTGIQGPVAVNDTFTVDEDSTLVGNVLDANPTTPDSDPDGTELTVTQSGPVVVAADGTFTLAPDEDYQWLDTGAVEPLVFTYTIADADGFTDTATATVSVTGVNDAPVVDAIDPVGADPGATAVFTASAFDVELPAQTLTFSLAGDVPEGATITADGEFSWVTPGDLAATTDYTFDVVVTDSGTPARSSSTPVTVTVGSINHPPVIDPLDDLKAPVGKPVELTVSATDPNLPAQTLTFSLADTAPAGASISADGVLSWTPTEVGVYEIEIVVFDDGEPALGDTETITIEVYVPNTAPVLDEIPDQKVSLGNVATFTATASDADHPAQTLTFTLYGEVPEGAAITEGGVFTWEPDSIGVVEVKVMVTDDGDPAMYDYQWVKITVVEPNVAPELGYIYNQVVTAGDHFELEVSATDANEPAQKLTFSLSGDVPDGMSIGSDGVISWDSAVRGGYLMTVTVTDDGDPNLSDSQDVFVFVLPNCW